MADELRLTISEPATVSGSLVPVLQTAGTYYLRADPFTTNTYTGTHIANGSWSFGTVQDGVYELWNASAKIASFGRKYISDNEPDFINVYVKAGGKVFTDTIGERTSAAGVTIDGVLIKDSLDGSGIVAKTGNQTGIAGNKTWTGVQTYSAGTIHNINTSGTGSTYRPTVSYSDGYVAPANDSELTEKKYVDDLVSTIVTTPFQESLQKVRVIVDGTLTTNQVYKTLSSAIASFGSPAVTKQCIVEIVDTGNLSQYITVSHAVLVNYVHLKGIAKHINLIMGVSGSSTTKTITLSDLTIFMGGNDISTDRTYNGLTFNNCDIYAYKNLTLTNCVLNNCRIFQPNGFSVTATGTTQLTNCILTNALTASGISGIGYVANTTSEVNTSYTMPTDPSTGGS